MEFANKPVFIIAGERQSGKTSFLLHLLHKLANADVAIAGFVSMHQPADDSYTIQNIQTQEEVRLMQRIGTFEQRPHHFELHPEGVETGLHWIQQLLKHPPRLAVVDEIGVYELSGKLWSEGFTQLVNAQIPLIFSTKIKHVKVIMERWSIEPAAIFYPDYFNNPEEAFNQIKKLL